MSKIAKIPYFFTQNMIYTRIMCEIADSLRDLESRDSENTNPVIFVGSSISLSLASEKVGDPTKYGKILDSYFWIEDSTLLSSNVSIRTDKETMDLIFVYM